MLRKALLEAFFHLDVSTAPSPASGITSPTKTSGSAETRRLMTILFGSIQTELNLFLTHYEKLEARYDMSIEQSKPNRKSR